MQTATVTVPFLDLHSTYLELKPALDEAVARVLDSGYYILGGEVTRFEEAFAAHVGARHCIGVANGLDALVLALKAMDIGPGDEVIVPSNTFIATWLAVSQCGATPVAVEPVEATHNIDPAGIRAAITPRTRAIIAVHLYGLPAEIEDIVAIAREHGLRVIEDAAQAHGASINGRRIGSHGDVVTWSFYPGKNLGAFGDGGAATCNDDGLARRIRTLGNYGSEQKYVHAEKGCNSRLDPLQAAILGVKLPALDTWNARRTAIAGRYLAELRCDGLTLPVQPPHLRSSWHLFVVRHPRRAALQAHLAAHGISTLIHYPTPPHQQGAYAADFAGRRFPLAERLATEVLSLPIGPHMSHDAVDRVIAAVRAFT